MDQLNTHSIASLYEAFAPAEAHRLACKLEIHHSPKHGSWLNIAEIELSVLSRQCLRRRIAAFPKTSGEVTHKAHAHRKALGELLLTALAVLLRAPHPPPQVQGITSCHAALVASPQGLINREALPLPI